MDGLHAWKDQMDSLSQGTGLNGSQPQQHTPLAHGNDNHERAQQSKHQQHGKQAQSIEGIADATDIRAPGCWR
jgi:hypothetical protein